MVGARWLSYLWPVRIAQGTGAHGKLELTWENGRLVVNSARANQSHGALHRVWQRVLSGAEGKVREAGSVLLLGLGTGSVVHILRHEMGLDTPITALEDDPLMIRWGREHFGLDKVRDLHLVQGDARAGLRSLRSPFDLVIVDVFEDLDIPPGWETEETVNAVMRSASPGGLVLWNTISRDPEQAGRVARLRDQLRSGNVECREIHPERINTVFMVRRHSGS
ncbi:MAG: hypothetical protein H6590_09385 [Flavobacteriales bacterium]|nr:hypothetical protein [Flavobacteriales bacterium]